MEEFNPELCILSGGMSECTSYSFPVPLYLPYEQWTPSQKLRWQYFNIC